MPEINKPQNLSKTWAQTGSKVEPSDLKKLEGWQPEIPTCEMFNWLDNRQDEAIAHINQHGIPVWDSTTEYIANKSYVQSLSGNVYVPKTDNTNVDPEGDLTATFWKIFKTSNITTASLSAGYVQGSDALTYKVTSGLLCLNGNFSLSGSPPSSLFTLPVIYRPLSNRYLNALKVVGGVSSPCTLLIASTGVITIINTTQASGDQYFISGTIPLW